MDDILKMISDEIGHYESTIDECPNGKFYANGFINGLKQAYDLIKKSVELSDED